MTKRIGVLGLTSNRNIGDYLLVEATTHLLGQLHEKLEITVIDADPTPTSSYNGRRRLNLKLFRFLRRRSSLIFKFIRNERFQYYYRYYYWWVKVNWHYSRSLKELDGLVIAGGGFIKFKTQGLNFFVEQILKLANRRSIPVMFNAVGVEGYDETDLRCRRLKNALNSGAVRMITTRDDYETLSRMYLTRPDISAAQVGDPVFWLDSMYPDFERKEKEDLLVGINLINPKNFTTYGGDLSEAAVGNFYKNLLHELDRRHIKYQLFGNGMLVDHRFGKDLVASMNLRRNTLARRPKTSDEFVDLYERYDVILAARMHAGITAYALGVPSVGLIWSEKIEYFANGAGLRDRYFDEQQLNSQNVVEKLTTVRMDPSTEQLRLQTRALTKQFLEQFVANL